MLTLYDYLPSQNAWKVRLLLNHLGRPYEQTLVSIFEGEGKSANYLAINPTGAVPAIQEEDGYTLAESNAILVYLASNTAYLPSETLYQAQVLQWLFFEADYVQSTIATRRHWMLTGKDKNRPGDTLTSQYHAAIKVLTVLNNRLGQSPFLAGPDYTIADMSVFAYAHLSDEAGLPLPDFSNIMRWIKAVRQQPGFLAETYPYSIDEYSYREL